jgi:hypothetical protein
MYLYENPPTYKYNTRYEINFHEFVTIKLATRKKDYYKLLLVFLIYSLTYVLFLHNYYYSFQIYIK